MTKPLFMWAGGKGKMLKHYASIPRPKYETYVEPFFGGGAMFLHENPSNTIINDINFEIMGIYDSIKDDPRTFIDGCMEYVDAYFLQSDRKAYYYGLRQEYWNEQSSSLLYVLMKLGFNGVWQPCKASNGLFGTPSGLLNQSRVSQIVDNDNIMEWHKRLQSVDICSIDYNDIIVPTGSFIYLDPPYRASFTTYGTGFTDEQQEEVVEKAKQWSEAGSVVWLANRKLEGDDFLESRLPEAKFYYFDVTYTAGRRKKTANGFEALKAREMLCILK